MGNTDKKRRAERDLKDLWQYIDAKYFQKFIKNELLSKVDQVLRQTRRESMLQGSSNKGSKTSFQVRSGRPDPEDQIAESHQKQSRGCGLGLMSQAMDVDSEQNVGKRSSKSVPHSESIFKSFSDIVNRPESLITLENLEERTFRQIYCEILDNLNVQTDWKLLIEKDHKNEEYREQLEKNIIKSKIRSIFDVEFNKKFEGSISIPIQTRSQSQVAPSLNRRQQQQPNQISSSGPQVNKYLFFITDKFSSEKKIENEERLKLKRRLDIERMEEQERQNRFKRMRIDGQNEVVTQQWPPQPVQEKRSPPKYLFKGPKNRGRPLYKPLDLGFLTSSTQVSSSGEGNSQDKQKTLMSTISNIDEELMNLEKIYEDTQKQITFDVNQMKKRIVAHREPEAVGILEQQIHQERVYLQNQIIQIEMKQIAESITRVTHARKVMERKQSYQDMVIEKYGAPSVRKTRQMASQNQQKQTDGKKSAHSGQNKLKMGLISPDDSREQSNSFNNYHALSNSQNDQSPTYITKENVGLLNRPLLLIKQLGLKEKIASKSASKDGKASNVDHLFRIEFDNSTGIPPCWVDTKTLNFFNTLRDNIFASSSQYDRFVSQNGDQSQLKKKKRSDSSTITVDKQSVAFQRGKRSCTLTDLKSQGPSTMKEFIHQVQGKKSVGGNTKPMNPKVGNLSLTQQAENLVKGSPVSDDQYLEYDFCHHCKQLKHKNLLVSCKYSSKHYQRQPNQTYTPYPYEPQVSQVNSIKIFNADLQNKSQIRGLIEGIKKDLKLKNQAVEAAQNQMKDFMIHDGTKGQGQLDIFAFQQYHPQLLTWIHDLEINPYEINPNSNTQLITDIKVLFPNFYQQLYQCQSPQTQKSVASKSKQSQESLKKSPIQAPNIDYECKKKFCSFCIRTNYDDNIQEIMKNKNWHCYHCTGYCSCTRCSRQDITTQLKAYLISLGGNLNILKDESTSIFDQLILKNFNEHLELTLGQNQNLYQKYPYYLYLIQNQDFVDPTQGDYISTQKQKPESNSLGFITQEKSSENQKSQQKVIDSSKYPESGHQNAEKAALSLLFKYSLLHQKYEDAPQSQNIQNQASSFTDSQLIGQIMESVDRHDGNVVQRIQKRRGRKKFILNTEDLSQDNTFIQSLNKREQKYLTKIAKMAEQPLVGQESSRTQPLLNGELVEFANEWPKNQKSQIQNIEKLMTQFGSDLLNESNQDDQSQCSDSASPKPRHYRGPGRPPKSFSSIKISGASSSVKKAPRLNRQWVRVQKNGKKVLRLNQKQQQSQRK